MRSLFGLLALPSLLGAASHQDAPLRAIRATTPIRIDGHLEEADWAKAPAATRFSQVYPQFGQASPLPSEVRVLYDDEAIYIGARLHHPVALDGGRRAIRTLVHRRDQDSKSDWFGVYIDSLHDRRTAMGFLVNAGGVQRDVLCFGDTSQDDSWDAVWESAVSQDDEGWTVEMRIPFSVLRINKTDGPQTWGINFMRRDEGVLRNWSFWNVVPRGESAFVSRFPDLVGLEGIEPKPRREVLPYLSLQRKFETAQPFDDRRWTLRGGVDAHLSLTSHSHVDATLRPDFGQVEVDQAVLNLSSVETYFPEKRPFFLEGMEIFNVLGPTLLYSRRIGVGLSPYAPATGESLLDSPAVTEINGAAKYTAKYPHGMNVGLLGAQVSSEKADVIDDASRQVRHPEVYPQTSFGVLRIQQQLDDQGSYLGTMHTFMRQASGTGRQALVDAVDLLHKSQDRSAAVDALVIRSSSGLRDEQARVGWFGRLHGAKAWSNGFNVDGLLVTMDRDFTVNDVGFRDRSDETLFSARVGQQWDRVAGIFRNWSYSFFVQERRDRTHIPFDRRMSLNLNSDTVAFFALWVGLGQSLPVQDDRELRTYSDPVKKYLRVPRSGYWNAGFDTPGNLPWYGRFTLEQSQNEGGPSTDWSLFQQIRPTGALDIQLQSGFTLDKGERKWLETDPNAPAPQPGQTPGAPITGLRRLSLFNQTLRVGYAFTPKLTLQLFAQWLSANWVFRDLRYYQDDATLVPGLPATYLGTPTTAFSFRTHAVNVIGRWEFRPGSTAYVVYTHGASISELANDHGGISPYHDVTRLQHVPSDDVVQLKVSWLFR